MRRGLPSGQMWRRPIIARIDRTAKKLNPLLVIVAVMLGLIDLSCYSALAIARWHPPRPDAGESASPPSTSPHGLLPPAQD